MARVYRQAKYILLTEDVIHNPIEDADESKSIEFDEESLDKPLEIYLSIGKISNVYELQFLVLKLMGYRFSDMKDIMPEATYRKVYSYLGHSLRSKMGKEKA